MVAAARPSWHGLQFAEQLAGQLAALGFVVVSGLARGIDAASHRGALAVGGKRLPSWSGLRCGLPEAKPGAVRTDCPSWPTCVEYPDGTEPKPYHFQPEIEL